MSEEKRPGLVQRILRIAGPAAPVLTALVLLVVGIGGGNAVNYASTPEFCNSCHYMSGEFQAWQESPHAPDVECIKCHSDPGAFGELAAHVKGVRMLFKTVVRVKPSLLMNHQISNAVCEKCHVMDDEKAQGVAVDHSGHLGKGVSCQDCHAGLVHKAPEYKAMSPDERYHPICLGCHESKNVVLKSNGPTSCTACHTDVSRIMPSTHKTDWMSQHGKSATQNQDCGQCHLATTSLPHGPMTQPALFVSTKQGDQCAACHQTTMPHTAPYLTRHGSDALTLGAQVCAKCHSPSTPANPNSGHASANFCSNCHGGVTMPHGNDWLAKHGTEAGTSENPTCNVCHSSANRVRPTAPYAANDFCIKCHAGLDMPHTKQWTTTHGQQALKSGISCLVCHSSLNPVNPVSNHASTAYCASCHNASKHHPGWIADHGAKVSPTCYICHSEEKGGNNSCQNCHNGKPEEKNPIHLDPYWFVNHRKAAQQQGEESCKTCHNEIQPSCSKCHSNR